MKGVELNDLQKKEYFAKAALSYEKGKEYLAEILMIEHGLDGIRLRRAQRSFKKQFLSFLKEDHSYVMDWLKETWASIEIDEESILLIMGDEVTFQPSISEINGIHGKLERIFKILGDEFYFSFGRSGEESLVNCLLELRDIDDEDVREEKLRVEEGGLLELIEEIRPVSGSDNMSSWYSRKRGVDALLTLAKYGRRTEAKVDEYYKKGWLSKDDISRYYASCLSSVFEDSLNLVGKEWIEEKIYHEDFTPRILSYIHAIFSESEDVLKNLPYCDDARSWCWKIAERIGFLFTNLDTTSKRFYLLILLHERDRMSLEKIFQLTRKSKTLELTQVCARSLYILQYEFQRDEEDPEYFHRKLQEIYAGGFASNDVKMFQMASRLRNMIENDYQNSEGGVEDFQKESWQLLDVYIKWGATDPQFKEQTEDLIREQFEIMKENGRITSEEGFKCLSRLGISIPRTYYFVCFENGNQKQKINAINGLSTSIDAVEILEFASTKADRELLRKIVHKLSKVREKYPNDDSAYKALGNILDKGEWSTSFEKMIRVSMGDAEYDF